MGRMGSTVEDLKPGREAAEEALDLAREVVGFVESQLFKPDTDARGVQIGACRVERETGLEPATACLEGRLLGVVPICPIDRFHPLGRTSGVLSTGQSSVYQVHFRPIGRRLRS